ncbi:putative sulfoacetate transporter SauU [Sporomusa silvacetica DSM 10669]|uniref:Sulfoacetate transporter SauU n=1 Tax=Sporomusa silvacetica DSM 10669 TaxID=1123289 RepID=A0ABZ3IIK3_9FIRM|nr:MFS transporter [Sporomusa silvacetica]OZC22239.1 putative sulfoacetate transporter SauU [Sporomusa silvacetica DSM 10669]
MNTKIGNKRWGIIFLIVLCYVVLYMDRSCMSIAGPIMMKHFNWTATDYGLVSTAFFVGYACTQILGGWLADRFGGGKVVIFGALWWSVFVFLTPFGSTLGLMIIIRIAMGWGEGVTLPANSSIVAQWMPRKESGLAQGLCLMGVPIGLVVTMPLSIWIMQMWDWQMIFHTFAFIAPFWVLLWLKFGTNKPEQHPTISREELAYIRADQGSQDTAGPAANLTARDIFSTGSIWSCAIAYFCANYLLYLFMTWLPNYFALGRHLDMAQTGLYSMVPYIVATFTYPLGGYLADRAAIKFGDNIGRKLYPIVGMAAAGALLVIGSQAPSAGAAMALISASNGLLCLTMGGFYSMPMVFSHQNAGKITGLFATFATIGGISAPTITGFIIDYFGSYEYALFVGAAVAVVGAIILLIACRVKPIECKTVVSQVV